MQQETEPRTQLVIVDIGKAGDYETAHLPGARYLNYDQFVRKDGKTGGLLPSARDLSATLVELGAGAQSYVVSYDRQGGSAAARLIWTLHAFGFYSCSLLNGGIAAWSAAGLPTENVPCTT